MEVEFNGVLLVPLQREVNPPTISCSIIVGFQTLYIGYINLLKLIYLNITAILVAIIVAVVKV